MKNEEEITLQDLMILIKDIKEEQMKTKNDIEKYHKVNMQKFAKINEFNKISDMINQVFEKRLSAIEGMLSEVFEI